MTLLQLLPRFRAVARALDQLAERETWSRTDLESLQLEKLNALWSHARQHVPYYRRLAEEQRLPTAFPDLATYFHTMPLLEKAKVQRAPLDFLSAQAQPGSWAATSGSTGQPLRMFWAHDAKHEMLRCGYRHRQHWGVDVFERAVYLWGDAAKRQPGWRGQLGKLTLPLTDWLRNRLRISAYHLKPSELRESLRKLQAFQPRWLYSYSMAGYLLALEAEQQQFSCDSLKLITLSSEPAFPHMIEKLQEVFRVPAVIEYGSVDCGFMAGEDHTRQLRVREDMVLLEALPRSNAEGSDEPEYELAVTILNNPSFPLFRYRIGDLTSEPLQYPQQGLAILKSVLGRNNDVIETKSGRLLHPVRFIMAFGIELQGAFKRYRLHQQANGDIVVLLEHDEHKPLPKLELVQKLIAELVEGWPVHVELVSVMPLWKSGKHRWIISDRASTPGGAEARSEVRPDACSDVRPEALSERSLLTRS